MKLLILCEGYPNQDGGMAMAFAHTRNVVYKECGFNVDVLNFSSEEDYIIDGVNVFSKSSVEKKNIQQYDLIIAHAPNIKHYLFFMLRHIHRINRLVFFYHGHEVLKINHVYPEPYPFIKKSIIRKTLQDYYDELKFFVWRRFIRRYREKLFFVFVSNWMKDQFMKWVHPGDDIVKENSSITYNSVSPVFENECFDADSPKEFDFITIRGYLDGSKYAMDIVNSLAKANPSQKFLVIGKGSFFNYYEKAENITWMDCTLKQSEMIEWMNKSKCALMPTRTDAQGVMMCEMEAFGMPVITSDIPVCHEVFDGFKNVAFISNDRPDIDLSSVFNDICAFNGKHDKYFLRNTVAKEISMFESLIK